MESPSFELKSLTKSDRGLLEAGIALAKATGKKILLRTAQGSGMVVEPKETNRERASL